MILILNWLKSMIKIKVHMHMCQQTFSENQICGVKTDAGLI